MLFSIGATEDAASGRAARPGGTDLFRQTLLGSFDPCFSFAVVDDRQRGAQQAPNAT
jgi:hypothetical protein